MACQLCAKHFPRAVYFIRARTLSSRHDTVSTVQRRKPRGSETKDTQVTVGGADANPGGLTMGPEL